MSAGVRQDEARARGRWRVVLAVLALVWLQAATPGAAQAVLAVDLVWISKNDVDIPGTDLVEANPGDTLVLEIRITVDEAGVGLYSLSVAFDEDGTDELDLVSTVEFEPAGLMNLTSGIELEVDSSNGIGGRAEGFEAVTLGTGPANITLPIGQITFVVTDNVAADGDDLEGSILTLFDGYEDNFNNFVGVADLPNPAFSPGFAAVPEPNRALLAAAALATLAILRSRQQSPQKTPGTLSREGR